MTSLEPKEFPEGWTECKFADLLDYIQPTDYIVDSTEYDDEFQTPVLTAGKSFIKGYTNEKYGIFEDLPAIIFDDFTTASRYINVPFKVKSSAMKILVAGNDLVNLKFVYYYMQVNPIRSDTHKRYWISVYARKSLLLPPLQEQNRIVAKIEELFSELDQGIEGLKIAREQLKVYRQAVLKHAFEGKLTEKWREENKGKLETADELLERIKKERDACYDERVREWRVAVRTWEGNGQDSRKPTRPKRPRAIEPIEGNEIASVPRGWLWFRYGDLCSIVQNGISKKPTGSSGTKIFRISAVRPMQFDLDDVRFIDNSNGKFDKYFLSAGDLVFTRYNGSRSYVGVCAQYKSKEPHLYPDKLIRTKLAPPSVLPGYVEKAANCAASRQFIESRIRTTAGQSGISGGDIKSMPVPICGMEEQTKILEVLDSSLSQISNSLASIDQNLQLAESMRLAILKKAFSGHLVDHDPDDEQASELLARIKAEKEEQEKAKKVGRIKARKKAKRKATA